MESCVITIITIKHVLLGSGYATLHLDQKKYKQLD